MGCFSLSCALSSLPIYNHNVYVMVIQKEKYGSSKFEIPKNFTNGDFFIPASPLIAAKCDTYGNVEDVVEDEALKYTCNMLGIEATEEAFHEWIEEEWMKEPTENEKTNRQHWVVFFRREVVDSVLKYCVENTHNPLDSNDQDFILKSFPDVFEYKGEIEGRYKYLYQLKDGRQIVSDGTWIHSFPKERGFYNTKDLFSWINDKSIKEMMSSDKMREILSKNSTEMAILKKKNETLSLISELPATKFMWLEEDYYDYRIKPVKMTDQEIHIYSQSIILTHYMHSCNRWLWPSYSGPQHNDYNELKHLNKLVAELLVEDTKDYEDE